MLDVAPAVAGVREVGVTGTGCAGRVPGPRRGRAGDCRREQGRDRGGADAGGLTVLVERRCDTGGRRHRWWTVRRFDGLDGLVGAVVGDLVAGCLR